MTSAPAVRFKVRRLCPSGECPVSLRRDGRCDCSDPVYLVDVDELLEAEVIRFCLEGTGAQRRELVEYFAGRRRRLARDPRSRSARTLSETLSNEKRPGVAWAFSSVDLTGIEPATSRVRFSGRRGLDGDLRSSASRRPR